MTLKALIAKKRKMDSVIIIVQALSIGMIFFSSLVARGDFTILDSFDRNSLALIGMNASTLACVLSVYYYFKVMRPFSSKLKRIYCRAYSQAYSRSYSASTNKAYNKGSYQKIRN